MVEALFSVSEVLFSVVEVFYSVVEALGSVVEALETTDTLINNSLQSMCFSPFLDHR